MKLAGARPDLRSQLLRPRFLSHPLASTSTEISTRWHGVGTSPIRSVGCFDLQLFLDVVKRKHKIGEGKFPVELGGTVLVMRRTGRVNFSALPVSCVVFSDRIGATNSGTCSMRTSWTFASQTSRRGRMRPPLCLSIDGPARPRQPRVGNAWFHRPNRET